MESLLATNEGSSLWQPMRKLLIMYSVGFGRCLQIFVYKLFSVVPWLEVITVKALQTISNCKQFQIANNFTLQTISHCKQFHIARVIPYKCITLETLKQDYTNFIGERH